MPNISNNGFWEGDVTLDHWNDENLCNYLIKFFKEEKIKNVVDFGCGMGYYVQKFIENDIRSIGFDGNPNTDMLTNNTCKVLDLSKPINFDTKYSWVISLEVGEHLPKEFEDIFIENLHINNLKGIILSWAVKGQGGSGHVNEQNNDYIKSKICKLGYLNDIEKENEMRNASTLVWFKNTIMVFRKI